MDKVLVTIPEAAGLLSLGRTKVYELMGQGKLRSVRIGRVVRIPLAEVQRFAARLGADQADGAGGPSRPAEPVA